MTLRLLHGQDERVVRWLEAKVGDHLMPPWKGIGVVDATGNLRAAHVLQPITYWTAEWTLYSEMAMTHGVIRAFFRFVFDDMGVHRLQIRTSRRNKAIRKAAPKFGFKFEGVAPGYWGPGGDALMFHMTRENCRWLGDKNAHDQRAVRRPEGAGDRVARQPDRPTAALQRRDMAPEMAREPAQPGLERIVVRATALV